MRHGKVLGILLALLLSMNYVYAEANHTVPRTAAFNIDEWTICKRVVNNANKDIFIPTKTQAEWNTFINNIPAGVSLTYCTPTAPPSLTAARQGTQGLLSWSSPSNNYGSAITNIKIYRGTSSGGETLYATLSNVNSYTDPSVLSSNYYYKVAAVNEGGEGTLSSEAILSSCNSNVIASCGSCSVSCGGGTQTCTNQCGGTMPPQSCNTQCCPVNGVWTDWSGWADSSGCSASCGGGTKTQQRTRSCTNPSPSCGGAACAGSSTDSQTLTCNTQSCCDPNIITSCGACSTTCGSGTKTCTNQCGATVPGVGCYDGSSLGQTSSCSTPSNCVGSCGSGTQSRTCYYTCGGSYSQSLTCTAGSSGDCGCGKGCCCPHGMSYDQPSGVCSNTQHTALWYCNDAAGGNNNNKACGGGPLVCHVCSCNW